MPTVIDSMTGVHIQSDFFDNAPTLEFFHTPTTDKHFRAALAHRLMDSLIVISFLTSDCSEVTRYYSEQELNEISQSIEACNSVLQALQFRPGKKRSAIDWQKVRTI